MKTDVEELSPTRVRLSVEVPFDELKPSLDKAYREVGRQVRIPGFRPGRVPPPVIDRRVGRDVVLSQAVNDAIPDLYAKAVADGDVYALGQPEVEITSLDDGKELTFTVEVDIRPKAISRLRVEGPWEFRRDRLATASAYPAICSPVTARLVVPAAVPAPRLGIRRILALTEQPVADKTKLMVRTQLMRRVLCRSPRSQTLQESSVATLLGWAARSTSNPFAGTKKPTTTGNSNSFGIPRRMESVASKPASPSTIPMGLALPPVVHQQRHHLSRPEAVQRSQTQVGRH